MDRGHLQNSDLNRSHEPVGIPLNRPPGTFSPTVGEGRDEGVRFMESLLSLLRTHWDHEPLRLTEARSGPRVCDPQPARFMGREIRASIQLGDGVELCLRTRHENSLLKKRRSSLTFAMAFPTQFQ